jgi:FkbM family methyltransferase
MFLAHRGNCFWQELVFSSYHINSAFDVGAHHGESLIEINRYFNSARITCFEPCLSFTQRLTSECHDLIQRMGDKFCLETLACSSIEGVASFVEQGPGSHLVANQGREGSEIHVPSQSSSLVKTIRLDSYIADKGYDSIDLLKIDVEGHEIEVLEGVGQKLLSNGFFRLIYLEAGVSTDNTHHTPFMEVVSYLHRHNYEIFGFYEQVNEFLSSRTHLRRVNIGFIHKSSIAVLPSNFNP